MSEYEWPADVSCTTKVALEIERLEADPDGSVCVSVSLGIGPLADENGIREFMKLRQRAEEMK